MPTPLTNLPNIGPAMADMFAKADIHDAETLRDMGTDAAYGALLRTGKRPHFIPFYVIEMALQGRPWNDCKGREKETLRVRFEAVKAANHDTDRAAFEAIMDAIGVLDRP